MSFTAGFKLAWDVAGEPGAPYSYDTDEEQKVFLGRFEMPQRHQAEEAVDWHPVAVEKEKERKLARWRLSAVRQMY